MCLKERSNSNRPLISKIQKKVIRAFKYIALKIEISSNLKIVNILDVTLNRSDNSYNLLSKSNTIRTYVNVNFNDPASLVKQIPDAINLRIMKLYILVVIKMTLNI